MPDYNIGYKKPPKNGQFKPGKSGNPKGRIKGNRNIKTDLKEELGRMVDITENGKKKKLSKQQVILKQLCAKSISGDIASARLLANFIMKYLADEPEGVDKHEQILPTEDRELLEYFVRNQKDKG